MQPPGCILVRAAKSRNRLVAIKNTTTHKRDQPHLTNVPCQQGKQSTSAHHLHQPTRRKSTLNSCCLKTLHTFDGRGESLPISSKVLQPELLDLIVVVLAVQNVPFLRAFHDDLPLGGD